MSQLIYSPATLSRLNQMKDALPHALLLAGPPGSGLMATARLLAGKKLEGITLPTDRDGNPDMSAKGIIRAKQIRALIHQAITKTHHHRVYIIDQADQMNQTAQNALLKSLEEPVPDTTFILTAHMPYRLLPTIRSRVQTVSIDMIDNDQSEALLDQFRIFDQSLRQQLLFLASGLPAEITRLATDETYLAEQTKLIRDARVLLQGKPTEKISLVEEYQAHRAKALQLLEAARTIIWYSVQRRATTDQIMRLDALENVYTRISANGNIRLQLMSFLV